MDIVTASRLAGQYCWVELQLFELLGSWMHRSTDPELVVALGDRCTRHGEHAEAWRGRIATIPAIDVERSVNAPGSAVASAIARLRQPESADDVLALAAAYDSEIRPAVLAAYRAHRAEVDPLLDGPTARLLDVDIACSEQQLLA